MALHDELALSLPFGGDATIHHHLSNRVSSVRLVATPPPALSLAIRQQDFAQLQGVANCCRSGTAICCCGRVAENGGRTSAEEVASTAEQLSSAVQEINLCRAFLMRSS